MTLPDDSQIQNEAEPTPSPAPDALPTLRVIPTPRREPLHFVVIVLLLADIVFGIGLAVFAEKVIAFQPMAVMGIGLAVLGIGILAYFMLLGDGAQKKRRRY